MEEKNRKALLRFNKIFKNVLPSGITFKEEIRGMRLKNPKERTMGSEIYMKQTN
jgi:hypothetical protein